MTNQQKIGIAAGALAVVVLIIWGASAGLLSIPGAGQPSAVATTSPATSSGQGTASNSPKPVTGSELLGLNLTPPSLTKPVSYSKDLPADAKALLATKIAELRAQVGKDKTNYDAWLDLAFRYKQAGDYAQAAAVWQYLADVHPDDAVSRHNLGDLYQHFLNDNAKAEAYYKAAISAQPSQSFNYTSLADLYVAEGNKSAALAVLKSGLSVVAADQKSILEAAIEALQ